MSSSRSFDVRRCTSRRALLLFSPPAAPFSSSPFTSPLHSLGAWCSRPVYPLLHLSHVEWSLHTAEVPTRPIAAALRIPHIGQGPTPGSGSASRFHPTGASSLHSYLLSYSLCSCSPSPSPLQHPLCCTYMPVLELESKVGIIWTPSDLFGQWQWQWRYEWREKVEG